MQETLRFIFPSDPSEARKAQDRIMDSVQKRKFDPDSLYAITIALQECVINAIKHGNRFDKSKNVILEAHVSDDKVEIIVEDQGEGFVRNNVPDPLAEENIERLHGRGLLLMEAYMNKVDYSKGGRRVRLVRLRNNHKTEPAA
jgi:serine/threonine-protein kinase RsbW